MDTIFNILVGMWIIMCILDFHCIFRLYDWRMEHKKQYWVITSSFKVITLSIVVLSMCLTGVVSIFNVVLGFIVFVALIFETIQTFKSKN